MPLSIGWRSDLNNLFINNTYNFKTSSLSNVSTQFLFDHSYINNTNLFVEPTMLNSTSNDLFYFELHVLLFYIAILSCSSFIQLYFYFKLAMMAVAFCIYIISFDFQIMYECLYRHMYATKPYLKIEFLLQMLFFIIFLHLIDRRVNEKLKLL